MCVPGVYKDLYLICTGCQQSTFQLLTGYLEVAYRVNTGYFYIIHQSHWYDTYCMWTGYVHRTCTIPCTVVVIHRRFARYPLGTYQVLTRYTGTYKAHESTWHVCMGTYKIFESTWRVCTGTWRQLRVLDRCEWVCTRLLKVVSGYVQVSTRHFRYFMGIYRYA